MREGAVPRRIEVERRKRQFAAKTIAELLSEADIANHELLPAGPFRVEAQHLDTYNAFLPLEFFDDDDFDDRLPEVGRPGLSSFLTNSSQYPPARRVPLF